MMGNLPFTMEQFLDLFGTYNLDLWPAQVAAYALGLAAAGLALARKPWAGRAVSAILAAFWLVNGALYHLIYFTRINPAAYAFAAVFILQAAFFLWTGVIRGRLAFAPPLGGHSVMGALILAFALAGYPLLGSHLGHVWPNKPMFGLAPCPTAIFTFGIMLWSTGRFPKHLLALPVLWAFVGFVAAVDLGMREDVGLLVAGLVCAALLLPRDLKPAQ